MSLNTVNEKRPRLDLLGQAFWNGEQNFQGENVWKDLQNKALRTIQCIKLEGFKSPYQKNEGSGDE